MKTKDLIIGVLAVAVVTLSILLLRSYDTQRKLLNEFSDDEKKFLCTEELLIKDGTIVDYSIAKDSIKAFENSNPDDRTLAFHFGLPNMNKIIEKANLYNEDHQDNPIVGFRFYRVLTSRKFTSVEHPDTEINLVKHPDLVIVPTLANSLLHEEDSSADVPIIWHSRPCPKLCKKKKDNKSR